MHSTEQLGSEQPVALRGIGLHETPCGHPRDFFDNGFVYVVITPLARGLSIGVNMNPGNQRNGCGPGDQENRMIGQAHLDVDAMAAELQRMLACVYDRRLRELPRYRQLPVELLQLRHVTLSGDAEPTMSPNFLEAMQAVIHVRALGVFPFFKLVLVTNAIGLAHEEAREGLKHLTSRDEGWIKLDDGAHAGRNHITTPDVPSGTVLANILLIARRRPIVIQSPFSTLNGTGPLSEEIDRCTRRLLELKKAGAQISLVQIYSAPPSVNCLVRGRVPLKCLSHIAQTVRQVTGLKAEVF